MKARPRSLALLAGTFWTAIGVFLSYRSFGAFQAARAEGLAGDALLAGLVALGAVLGIGKGMTVLRKSARRNVARLATAGASAPSGRLSLAATFTPAMWGVIVGMSALGMALRFAGLSPLLLGPILLAVGLGLLLGAAHYFAGAKSLADGPAVAGGGEHA